jgi:crossover junction endodeoxyribonuclease RuvC
MIILGVDPGSHVTGYGVIVTPDPLRVVAAGIVRTDARASLPDRLKRIYQGMTAVIEEHRPDEMAVESLFNARNARSSLVLGHARGVVLLAGALAGIRVAEYTPREVKLALTGNGAAAKEQVRSMVERCLGMRGPSPPLDQSDAFAVAICHATRGELDELLARDRGDRW